MNAEAEAPLRRWIEFALSYLQRHNTPASTNGTRTTIEIIGTLPIESTIPVSSFPKIDDTMLDELMASPEYKAALAACSADIEAVQSYSLLAGINTDIEDFDLGRVLTGFLVRVWRRNRSLSFNESAFSETFQELLTFVHGKEVHYQIVAPLARFDSWTADRLDLGGGMQIRRLTDSEYEEMYLDSEEFRQLHPRQYIGSNVCAITLDTQERKALRSDGNRTGLDTSRWGRNTERIMRLLTILRVLKDGTPGVQTIWERVDWMYPRHYTLPNLPWTGKTQVLRGTDIEPLRRLWQAHEWADFKQDRFLRVALDRFSSASEKISEEDKIIDLGICMESLLLHGSQGDHGQVAYRFALHGAHLLGQDKAERVQVFNDLRCLYKLRSALVHGDTYDLKKVIKQAMPLLDYRVLVERRARQLLKLFLLRVKAPSQTASIDWVQEVLFS